MQNKLQELTDRLYNEGLSKGKQEGEELISKAKTEAAQIIRKAQEESERIIAQAQKQADELATKVNTDIKMAASQSISVVKQSIENALITRMVNEPTASLMSNGDFVKEMIKAIVAAFNPSQSQSVDLDIILPESLKAQVESFIRNEVAQQFNTGLTVSFSKKMNGGFKVTPKDGGYMLLFTDEEFQELIASYLRPATKKILFG